MGIGINAFKAAFVANKKGGLGTSQRAGATWRALNSFVESKRWKDVNPTTITTKQIRAFVEHRQAQTKKAVENMSAAVRAVVLEMIARGEGHYQAWKRADVTTRQCFRGTRTVPFAH